MMRQTTPAHPGILWAATWNTDHYRTGCNIGDDHRVRADDSTISNLDRAQNLRPCTDINVRSNNRYAALGGIATYNYTRSYLGAVANHSLSMDDNPQAAVTKDHAPANVRGMRTNTSKKYSVEKIQKPSQRPESHTSQHPTQPIYA